MVLKNPFGLNMLKNNPLGPIEFDQIIGFEPSRLIVILDHKAQLWKCQCHLQNLRNVNVIYNDSSLYRIHQTEQSTDKSCPSTTGPANNSNFVPSFKYTTYPQKPISNSFHADIVNTKTTITNIQTKRLDSVQKTLNFFSV